MSNWDANGTAPADGGGWNTDNWNDGGATGSAPFNDGFGEATNNGFGEPTNGFDAQDGGMENLGGADGACRNCGEEGHFARDCSQPRKVTGACFNCGEEGHNKVDCTAPRKPNGPCRVCEQEGHFAADCPNRKCKNCLQEGHDAHECKNAKVVNDDHVANKSEDEAWAMLEQASEERDIADFKEAVHILTKATPGHTYASLEKEFRSRGFAIFLIAMEKDHGDTWTNVNLQGEIGKKYAVSYFTSDKAQRPTLIPKWPKDAEDNLLRLADAGIPLDRGVDKCNNCGQIGHKSRACKEERTASEQPKIFCHLCNEEGHRVRDCTQERRSARACKVCESEEHLAKDCPEREKQTCRRCGEEGHMIKDCTQERKIECHNCGGDGHMSKECPEPRKPIDWSKVTCRICNKTGHGIKRCPEAQAEEAKGASGAGFDHANGGEDSGGDWEGGNQGNTSAPSDWEGGNQATSAGAGDWEQNATHAPSAPPLATGGGW